MNASTSNVTLSSWTSVFTLAGILLGGYGVIRVLRIGKRDGALPPGPPTVPLLGNLHQFPTKDIYVKLTEWARQYGGIYTLKLGPQNFIVVSDPRIEKELLEVKSASTSDRPPNHFFEKVTDGKHTAFARYDHDWRRSRRIIYEWFSKDACARRIPLQQAEATQFLHDLLHDPERFSEHSIRYSNSLVTSILAGIRSPRWDSPMVFTVRRMMQKWCLLAEPGAQPPIDLIPILRYVPERWASWKTAARGLHTVQQDIYNGIIRYAEERIRKGEPCGSAVEMVLPTLEERGVDEALLRGIIASIFEGATGTSSDYIRTLILLLVKHPHVQERAQEELDRIVGNERAPTLEDYETLPYCMAIVKEVNRFRPVATLTAPHYTTQDETFDGFYIPKHSTIIVNMYGIFHDSEAYDDPDLFIPERFLTSEFGTKPGVDDTGRRWDMHFGAGRRICGGLNLANNSMAINTMNLLWAFTFRVATHPETGKPIPVSLNDFTTGLTSGPSPFQCNIHVRSAKHAAIIEKNMGVARADVFSTMDEKGLSEELIARLQSQIELL